jgi:hypothetical protein
VAVITSVPAAAIAADASRHPEGVLKLADRQLVAGTTVPIRGQEFAEHGKLELLLVGVAGRFRLGDVTADSVGDFTQSFDIPADLDVGTYRLIAVATDDDEVASLNVELLAAPVDADMGTGHMEDDRSHDAESAEDAPTDEPLILDRAGSPWVRSGAVVGIIIALVGGGLLLRKSTEPV